jgi:hypothetical protein
VGSTDHRGRRAALPLAVLLGVVAASVAARLPLLTAPLSSDEGGFLMVAAQWHAGSSLYGDYWVDRPPLLVGLFSLADLGGGAVALRLLGTGAVVVAAGLAAALGAALAPGRRWAPVLTGATAAVFLSSPLFGADEVDGELLAVPLVLLGILGLVRADGSGSRRARVGWWAVAGAAGTAALAVKQSMAEVVVALAAVVAWSVWIRRPRRAGAAVLTVAASAAVTAGALVWWASSHGTSPAGLWDAVVTFRGQASEVIARWAPAGPEHRAPHLLVAFLLSGAAWLLLPAFLPHRRRARREAGGVDGAPGGAPGTMDPRVLAAAVLGWELLAVVAGGSYWLHYLVGTVPGLVLAVAAALRHQPSRARWTLTGLGYATVAVGVALAVVLVRSGPPTSDTRVEAWLGTHARPGDTGVVAFGHPSLLRAAGLESPYPELWSLPVRVRDPRLATLTGVLAGPDAPTWLVVAGEGIATWGVDADRAQAVVDARYREVDVEGTWHVLHRRGWRDPAVSAPAAVRGGGILRDRGWRHADARRMLGGWSGSRWPSSGRGCGRPGGTPTTGRSGASATRSSPTCAGSRTRTSRCSVTSCGSSTPS